MPCRKCGERKALSTRSVCYKCNVGGRDRSAYKAQSYRYRRACADRITRLMCEFCERQVNKPSDLHVDHINGQHSDDTPSNWQVLCVPCHVMKTRLKGEYRRH
jgi:hypothetical protein